MRRSNWTWKSRLTKKAIIDINSRVSELEVTSKDDTYRSLLHRVVDVVTDTEKAPKVPQNGNPLEQEVSWSENVTHGLTWFSIGPSRSMWILGFFIPVVWVLGSLYIFSKVPTRRAGGVLNLVMWLIYLVLSLIFNLSFMPIVAGGKNNSIVNTILLAMGVILGVVFVVVRRIRKRIEKRRRMEKLHKLRLDLIDSIQKHAAKEGVNPGSKKTA